MYVRPAGESDDEDYSDFDEPPVTLKPSINAHKTFTSSIADDLENAIKNKSTEKVREILQKLKKLSEITMRNGLNVVTFAARLGNYEIFKLIFEHEPPEEKQDTYTPLMAACNVSYNDETDFEDRKKCIKLLLDAGIDIDFKDRYGTNALMLASKLGRSDIVEFLLENEAEVNECDNDGWTPLFHAVNGRHPETVSVLLKYNANIKKVDKRSRKAYDIAYQKNFTEILQLLDPTSETSQNDDKQVFSEPYNHKRHEILESLNPKFHSEAVEMISSANDLDRYVKLFHLSDISLRDFITLRTDEELKKIGVTFSAHRNMILHRIRLFHLGSWSPSSFGLSQNNEKPSQYCSLIKFSNFMATIYRQLYSLRCTFIYMKEDVIKIEKKDSVVASLIDIRNKLLSMNARLRKIKKTAEDISFQTRPFLSAQKIVE